MRYHPNCGAGSSLSRNSLGEVGDIFDYEKWPDGEEVKAAARLARLKADMGVLGAVGAARA